MAILNFFLLLLCLACGVMALSLLESLILKQQAMLPPTSIKKLKKPKNKLGSSLIQPLGKLSTSVPSSTPNLVDQALPLDGSRNIGTTSILEMKSLLTDDKPNLQNSTIKNLNQRIPAFLQESNANDCGSPKPGLPITL